MELLQDRRSTPCATGPTAALCTAAPGDAPIAATGAASRPHYGAAAAPANVCISLLVVQTTPSKDWTVTHAPPW